MNKVMRIERVDRLKVEVHPTRAAMGVAAASACRRRIFEVLTHRALCRMIFAAAPSQNEVMWNRGPLATLAGHPLGDDRVTVREIDVAQIIRAEHRAYYAILLDVDNGPRGLTPEEQ